MLWFYGGVLAVLGLSWLAYRFWAKRVDADIAVGAELEWERLSARDPELLNGMSKEKFLAVYRRVHFPRFPGYALACAGTFLASLPVTFALLAAGLLAGEKLGFAPQPAEIVRRVNLGEVQVMQSWQCGAECQLYIAEGYSGFYYFFGVVIVWILIVTFFMRRYHARRPGYIRDEIIRSR
ncbi:MAG: hypothetical protein RIC52_11475 [Amphiplicatus sp.]